MWTLQKSNKLALALVPALAIAGVLSAGAQMLCDEAFEVEINSTFRGFADREKSAIRLKVEVPALVMVEVSPPGGPRLELLERICHKNRLADLRRGFVFLEEKENRLFFAALRPETFFIGLKNEAQNLGSAYELTASLVPVEARERLIDLGPARVRLTELYPHPAADGSDPLLILLALPRAQALAKDDHEVDPDPSSPAVPIVVLPPPDPDAKLLYSCPAR